MKNIVWSKCFWIVALCLLGGSGAHAAQFDQSWVAPNFTLCEGVGASGTFRVYITGKVSSTGAGKAVTYLVSHVSSGAFAQFTGSLSVRALVKIGGIEKQNVTLSRSVGPALESASKADESARLYLPANTTLSIPPNGELWISAMPSVKTDAGHCSLGSSESKIILP